MLKRLGQSRVIQATVGALAFGWLWLVRVTTRFQVDPEGFPADARREEPIIIAMWHGQHFMISYAWPPGMRVSALISRSGDGELNARVLRLLGVEPIRGSGGAARKMRKRGGVVALREMLRRLDEGSSVALTADVPKVARVCGAGIVTLARLSGRPIYPVAVVCRWRIDFRSWDRASIGLPFGRGAMALGTPVRVAADANAAAQEDARMALQRSLNEAHGRAYALVDSIDPGLELVARAGGVT